jgi:hypothetical protein
MLMMAAEAQTCSIADPPFSNLNVTKFTLIGAALLEDCWPRIRDGVDTMSIFTSDGPTRARLTSSVGPRSIFRSHYFVTNRGTRIFGTKSPRKCVVIVIQRFRL